MDNVTKSQVGVFSEADIIVSEPVFVARPGGEDEDDGVILSLINKDHEERYAGLLILDGRTFAEIARVEVMAAGPVTATIHGGFRLNASGERVFKEE